MIKGVTYYSKYQFKHRAYPICGLMIKYGKYIIGLGHDSVLFASCHTPDYIINAIQLWQKNKFAELSLDEFLSKLMKEEHEESQLENKIS